MDRRTFLQLIAATSAAAVLPGRARAFGDTSRLVFAVGRHAGAWDRRSSGLRRLAFEIGTRTSISTMPQEQSFDLDSPELFAHPFLYITGDGALAPLAEAQVENLRRYLTYGGFILCDGEDAAFADSCDRELARVLPGSTSGRIPAEHVIYKSFYLIDQPAGRLLTRPYLGGVVQGPRVAAVVSANDLGGAWSRDELGSWDYEVSPGGESQREVAFRLGVNLAMYAMCTDYKDDQVHIPFIMRRRR
jgi:hypothetical protein